MGRAPTSGNCHTCRLRRVKCDKGRPACERCLRAGYECQGYETVLRMQSHAVVAGAAPGSSRLARIQTVSSFPEAGPDTAETAASSALAAGGGSGGGRGLKRYVRRPKGSSAASSSGAARAAAGGGAEGETAAHDSHSSHAPSRDPGRPSNSPPANQLTPEQQQQQQAQSSLPQELSLTPFIDDISFAYLFHSYGWINMHSILLQDSGMRGHLAEEGMAHDSLRALAYGLLARDQRIQPLQESAHKVYGETLRTLRGRITSRDKEELAALVKPIALMGSYAVSVENDLRFTHHRGLARILEHCGPEYFQSPSMLPVFESVRLTLISDAVVRRQATFLARPEWKTVPWALSPVPKSATNRLLDILTAIPGIIEGVWSVAADRVSWILAGCDNARRTETPETVPGLQAGVRAVEAELAEWRAAWEADIGQETAHQILEWSFRRAQDDAYRPGIGGVQGPDIFNANLMTEDLLLDPMLTMGEPAAGGTGGVGGIGGVYGMRGTGGMMGGMGGSGATGRSPSAPFFMPLDDHGQEDPTASTTLFTHMQDVALYTTVLVWTSRLTKYLAQAARSPTAVDFFTAPFYTTCECWGSLPPRPCETVPPPAVARAMPAIDPAMAWNASACRVTAAPMRVSSQGMPSPSSAPAGPLSGSAACHPSFHGSHHPNRYTYSGPCASPAGAGGMGRGGSPTGALDDPNAAAAAIAAAAPLPCRSTRMLVPGDVRFASQLRILSWLCDRLPASRGHVLATLAAIGLGHCAHDVRPAEGLAEVAAVVTRLLDSTCFEGASDILLKSYRPVVGGEAEAEAGAGGAAAGFAYV